MRYFFLSQASRRSVAAKMAAVKTIKQEAAEITEKEEKQNGEWRRSPTTLRRCGFALTSWANPYAVALRLKSADKTGPRTRVLG